MAAIVFQLVMESFVKDVIRCHLSEGLKPTQEWKGGVRGWGLPLVSAMNLGSTSNFQEPFYL